eukprot:806346-Pyramimonas_sp.AAC.1
MEQFIVERTPQLDGERVLDQRHCEKFCSNGFPDIVNLVGVATNQEERFERPILEPRNKPHVKVSGVAKRVQHSSACPMRLVKGALVDAPPQRVELQAADGGIK